MNHKARQTSDTIASEYQLTADLNVSLTSAELLVSLYALGVATGAPVITALTGKWNRKIVLLTVMSLFVVGSLRAWQAPGYNTLIAARILTVVALLTVYSFRTVQPSRQD